MGCIIFMNTIRNYCSMGAVPAVGAEATLARSPKSVILFFPMIPMKIVVFRCDAGIVTTLSLMYDDCRRPRRGFLCGGSVTKIQKTPSPPCAGEDLRWGSFVETIIFMVRV